METTFIAALTRSLHQHGEKTALTFVRDSLPGEGIAFGRLNRYVNRFAHSLLEMGVAKGDRVILAMDKCPALLLAHLAILKVGAISVPLNPGFKKPEMEYFLNDSGAIGKIQKLPLILFTRAGLKPEIWVVLIHTGTFTSRTA